MDNISNLLLSMMANLLRPRTDSAYLNSRRPSLNLQSWDSKIEKKELQSDDQYLLLPYLCKENA